MATESELRDLLVSIADRSPEVERILGGIVLGQKDDRPSDRHRWLAVGAGAAVVAAIAVLSVSLSGLSGNSARPTGASAGTAGSSATGKLSDQAIYVFPLDAYTVSPAQERELKLAQYTLARRCASTHSITVPMIRVPSEAPQTRFLNRYAASIRPLTTQQAQTLGYYLPSGPTDGLTAALSGLSPAQRVTFQGWSQGSGVAKPTSAFLLNGGCLGRAARDLTKNAVGSAPPNVSNVSNAGGLFDDDEQVLQTYVSASFSGETTPAVNQARRDWATCMASNGYPGLIQTQDAISSNGPHPRTTEAKREARQDVQCKQSSGFLTAWVASIARAQKTIIEQNQQQLTQIKQRLSTRLKNAAEALSR